VTPDQWNRLPWAAREQWRLSQTARLRRAHRIATEDQTYPPRKGREAALHGIYVRAMSERILAGLPVEDPSVTRRRRIVLEAGAVTVPTRKATPMRSAR
jgi:hypothetical protein